MANCIFWSCTPTGTSALLAVTSAYIETAAVKTHETQIARVFRRHIIHTSINKLGKSPKHRTCGHATMHKNISQRTDSVKEATSITETTDPYVKWDFSGDNCKITRTHISRVLEHPTINTMDNKPKRKQRTHDHAH